MSKYLCEECQWNNNGWCKIKQFNGLKKKNIQECDKYKEIINTDDEHLSKLLENTEKKKDKFWNEYEDEESLSNDLLGDAVKIMYLQETAIEILLEKIKK